MIVTDIMTDAIFAAVAGIGFGAISNPPLRVFKYIGILAALGHASRFCLMEYANLDISSASLAGSCVIGFVSLYFACLNRVPRTVLFIPALLPMIPGKFAYNTMFSLITFMQNMDETTEKIKYLDLFLSNFLVTFTTLFCLAIGSILPMLLFPKIALSFTREKRR
ncbi:MAG: threonine/serine exporter family protein [Bacteroidales bacterium]